MRASVCLTQHSAPVICEADSATPLCVRSSVCPSVCSSVTLCVVTGPEPEPLLQKWKESVGQVPVHEDGHGVYWVGREAFSFFLNSLISFAAFFTQP